MAKKDCPEPKYQETINVESVIRQISEEPRREISSGQWRRIETALWDYARQNTHGLTNHNSYFDRELDHTRRDVETRLHPEDIVMQYDIIRDHERLDPTKRHMISMRIYLRSFRTPVEPIKSKLTEIIECECRKH